MPEAVIVDAVRTPIGRAGKGSLKDVRADDLAAVPLAALVERNPEVDFAQTADILMGCGFPLGEQGYNLGRNAQLLAGIDHHVPAVTVSRFCSSSLQALRMAFHAIVAGEGDQYIAAGSEAVSRFPGAPAVRPALRAGRLRGRALQRLHPDGADGRERRRALQRLARVPGRVGGELAAACGRRAGARSLRRRDRARDACRRHAGEPRRRAACRAPRSRCSPSSSRRSTRRAA